MSGFLFIAGTPGEVPGEELPRGSVERVAEADVVIVVRPKDGLGYVLKDRAGENGRLISAEDLVLIMRACGFPGLR